ncbi:hypothetical protein HII36_39465 [Nonomuraea sp. NN258]|uniref:hypothetical protein n=1 Tax=Nonomuraea antri TaxID=2730852 RepID=UPI00156973BF|nr:hypothetical protein [Nonomuraea antri]NRQ37867.1 hypothetical protein [Nonomuraea antri]
MLTAQNDIRVNLEGRTHMSIKRVVTMLVAGTLAVSGLGLTTATTLAVGAAPAEAVGPCGSGYARVGAYRIPPTGTRTGTLEVYYNSGNGKNCALAYGYGATYGKKTWKAVSIARADGGDFRMDGDEYEYYAGPVYLSAPGQCIDVRGAVTTGKQTFLNNVHCG